MSELFAELRQRAPDEATLAWFRREKDDLFKIIGVSPVLGRDFSADDNKAGAPKTAILGDKIWRRDFNADPTIVGQSVTINGKAATIIGVMPPNFKFPVS